MTSFAKSIIRGGAHTALAPLERRLLRQAPEPRWPHVFIVGAPRSGTSLFYELLVARYHFAFFTNIAHRFYKTPVAASWLGRSLIRAYQPQYTSEFGHISGWSAPNEGGWIWQRWLEDGPWVDERAAQGLKVDDMRATLAALSAMFDAPFINKNVMHSNRIRLMNALFPGCLFIEVRRDLHDTARSIIRAQQRHKGPEPDAENWWSVRPSNAGGDDMVERAWRQVTGVAKDIARDCAALNQDCLLSINYEDLCENTSEVFDIVYGFLSQRGIRVSLKSQVPEQFERHPSKPLAPEIEARLTALSAIPAVGA